jgi:hypothetical protein|tara:strand:+ start:287 stop:796 length:510 start_codon:yes stop_codon:yes gene_type:complete
MYQKIFETPIWIQNIEPQKLNLISTNFKKSWLSETPTSFSENEEDNKMDEDGKKYLKSQVLFCLQDVGINDCEISQIWRNVYNGDFQEKHCHVNSNFSFTIYEKLKTPQTVFEHPAHDMIYATNVDKIFGTVFQPNVKENQMILFPSYLQHMVKKSFESMTISGNVHIK